MKTGIYLIEVKECPSCKGWRPEDDKDRPHDNAKPCKLCGWSGYVEERIDARAWLFSLLNEGADRIAARIKGQI